MLLDPTHVTAYILVAFTLAITPGSDTLFVIATSMRHKTRGGIIAALGISAGSLTHACAAALGVSAIIAASPLLFDLLRYGGALYLAYMGWQALKACWDGTASRESENPIAAVSGISDYQLLKRGFLNNMLNPKIILFYLALLPQFVNPALGHIGVQILLLGAIFIIIGLAFLLLIGYAAGRAADWLAQTALQRWLDGIAGIVFCGLAIRIALGEKPTN